jgi:ankyrin repeat protein
MPPLFAITHSTLLRLPDFRDRLRQCARLLLDAGADPNQSWEDKNWGHPVTALYGAAGKNHDATLTKMLLDAGANPNDGESLYHAVEGVEPECLRLLLDAGARVEGSNALHHQLDMENLERLRLMLAHTKDANDTGSALGNPLIWAIRRRRSLSHVEALVKAGADPRAKTKDGISAYVFALQSGLRDVAEFLRKSGASETLSVEDRFIVACAAADKPEAERLLAENPDMFSRLSEAQLRQLPNLTESRNLPAVRMMVELGWPIAATGGDWQASALNLAVYQGDPELTRFLLEHGASWTERHGFGDNVNGILGWASRNEPPTYGYYEISGGQHRLAVLQRDWVGCARALVEHGMPLPESGQDYSEAVAAFFAEQRNLRNPR